MYNFYQSSIRKDINNTVFHKPTGEIQLFGHLYQYIIREKKIGPIALSRLQIIGINALEKHTYKERKIALQALVNKYSPIFIQLGCIDTIAISTAGEYRDNSYCTGLSQTRNTIIKDIVNAGFVLAGKENLPPSSYYINLKNTRDERFAMCNNQTQTKIKKAEKKGILIKQATLSERTAFASILTQTGSTKGFGVISEHMLHSLLDYTSPYGHAELFVASQDNNIIAGAVYLIDRENKTATYLYGGTDRQYMNIGASHLLHWEIQEFVSHQGCETIDLLGGHPTGDTTHHLAGVGQFKEGFGGTKYDYVGSFDIIYNTILYKMWRFLRKK